MHQTNESSQTGQPERQSDSLALLVQEVEQRCGLLADEINAACVVDVVDVVPADALRPVFLLHGHTLHNSSVLWHPVHAASKASPVSEKGKSSTLKTDNRAEVGQPVCRTSIKATMQFVHMLSCPPQNTLQISPDLLVVD